MAGLLVAVQENAENNQGGPVSGLKIIVAALVGTSLLVPSSSASSLPPRTDPPLAMSLLSVFGSGCPANTTDVEALPSGSFTLRYRGFSVSGNDYKSCRLSVRVKAPTGWSFSVPSVSNQATVKLDATAAVTLSTAMWFTGFPWTVRDIKKVAGPLNRTWNTSAVPRKATWSPCGASVDLSIAETVRVTGSRTSTAKLVGTTFGLPKWRRC
ncbi:DUF4360 domain-containing protein [Actinoplanes sp. NPDC023936]|uniref:DUF4360 domain-containing protein n=1 Tax=Actinoplanes sp. NPDC023936 TaxID=3154910 RepID=UPI003404CC01